MAVRIESKIVAYEVVTEEAEQAAVGVIPPAPGPTEAATPPLGEEHNVIQVQPLLKRPEELHGATYKIKTPLSEHALYVTINDIEVNSRRRPFEIFINSKNMENFAWIVALTRTMSAVFRHGGDVAFLVDELRSVFDPKGGYFKPGGKWMPSLIAEIGDTLERHLFGIGMIKDDVVVLSEKVAAAIGAGIVPSGPPCPHCQQAMILLDGCHTCTACGYSKCG